MLLKGPCKVKTIHLLTSQDEVRFFTTYFDLHICMHQLTEMFLFLLLDSLLADIYNSFNFMVFQDSSFQQVSALEEIKQSLQSQNICLDIQYSSTIHDREIRYNPSQTVYCVIH